MLTQLIFLPLTYVRVIFFKNNGNLSYLPMCKKVVSVIPSWAHSYISSYYQDLFFNIRILIYSQLFFIKQVGKLIILKYTQKLVFLRHITFLIHIVQTHLICNTFQNMGNVIFTVCFFCILYMWRLDQHYTNLSIFVILEMFFCILK